MARRTAGRPDASTRPYVVLAVIVISLLVVGSIASVSTSSGDSASVTRDEPEIRITPGEEVARLQTVIAQNPDDSVSMGLLAEILANSGRIAESVPWYERAVARRPDDVALRIAFGRSLQRNGSDYDAQVQFRSALDVDPDHQAAAFYLANVFEEMAVPRFDDARIWYQRAIDADPDNVIAGQARERLDNIDESATPSNVTP